MGDGQMMSELYHGIERHILLAIGWETRKIEFYLISFMRHNRAIAALFTLVKLSVAMSA